MKNAEKTYTRATVKTGFVSAAVTFAGFLYFFLSLLNERMMLIDRMPLEGFGIVLAAIFAVLFFIASARIFTRAMKVYEYMEKNKVSTVKLSEIK